MKYQIRSQMVALILPAFASIARDSEFQPNHQRSCRARAQA
jgi:hypothetical protein